MPKREPSLHITQRVLKKEIITYMGSVEVFKFKVDDLVEHLMTVGRKYSLRHRSLLESNQKIAQRASKLKSSSKGDAFEFSRTYTLVRRQMKHKGVRVITERDGVQWEYINQAAGLAREFAKDYEMKYPDACQTYITIALNLIKPWSLNKFKMGDERIRLYYDAVQKLEKDPNSQTTSLIFDIYQAKVAEKTGISLNYDDNPGEYAHFIEAGKICKEINIHPKYFVTAQFEQLDWTNGYPTPSQLGSFKAKERAVRWMTENNIRIKQENKKRTKLQDKFFSRHANNAE